MELVYDIPQTGFQHSISLVARTVTRNDTTDACTTDSDRHFPNLAFVHPEHMQTAQVGFDFLPGKSPSHLFHHNVGPAVGTAVENDKSVLVEEHKALLMSKVIRHISQPAADIQVGLSSDF